MKKAELAVQETAPDMMSLMRFAIENASGMDVIERLGAMQKEARDYQAMVDFNEALQRCQDGLQPIRATLDNSATGSKYANYLQLDRVIRPIYSKEGFSLSFSTEESMTPETVIVVCFVSRGGYSRRYAIPMATDGKGPKGGSVMTRTHAVGAAASYGMRYLLKMIFNIAVGEDDTDGNLLSEEERQVVVNISAAASEEELTQAYKKGTSAALQARNMTLVKLVLEAKDNRKKELAEKKETANA